MSIYLTDTDDAMTLEEIVALAIDLDELASIVDSLPVEVELDFN